LSYCQQLISRPLDTVLILISDLYEGGNQEEMRRKATHIAASGVQVIALLALNDEGAPYYDHHNASYFASIGIPVFACTPDKFPDLMAAALGKQDIYAWAGSNDIKI
jgi:hypothetical protein